jgi:tetratricopeptide (TPR) repeat protein
LEEVLPDRPALIYRAAVELFSKPGADPVGARFLKKALHLLLQKPEANRHGEEFYLAARIYSGLGQWDDARASYGNALVLEPRQTEWRFEFARLLYDRGMIKEARRELAAVLKDSPNHDGARELYKLGVKQGPQGES